MVNVDIEKELYEDIKRTVQKRKYHYPSIKFFVQKSIYNELLSTKNYSDDNFDELYSKLKETIRFNPELRAKVDEMHGKEIKRLRKAFWGNKEAEFWQVKV